ncbi:MAG: ATP-binding cassette domain-containing protein [Thermomicrobiales bacterium]
MSNCRSSSTACCALPAATAPATCSNWWVGRARSTAQQLSGGEQQRVAIAVALANDLSVLLADELTGELDSTTAADIFRVLRTVNERSNDAVIVMHDPQVRRWWRTATIRDGAPAARRCVAYDDGEHGELIAEEFAVLDHAPGGVWLPREYVDALEPICCVRLTLDVTINVFPDESVSRKCRRKRGGGVSSPVASRQLPDQHPHSYVGRCAERDLWTTDDRQLGKLLSEAFWAGRGRRARWWRASRSRRCASWCATMRSGRVWSTRCAESVFRSGAGS